MKIKTLYFSRPMPVGTGAQRFVTQLGDPECEVLEHTVVVSTADPGYVVIIPRSDVVIVRERETPKISEAPKAPPPPKKAPAATPKRKK